MRRYPTDSGNHRASGDSGPLLTPTFHTGVSIQDCLNSLAITLLATERNRSVVILSVHIINGKSQEGSLY